MKASIFVSAKSTLGDQLGQVMNYNRALLLIYWSLLAVVCVATSVIIYFVITLAVNFAEPWKQSPLYQALAILLPLVLLWFIAMARLADWANEAEKRWRWYAFAAAGKTSSGLTVCSLRIAR